MRAFLGREGEYWTVRTPGSVLRLRDSKGLRYLAVLVSNPGVELHAVDLVAAGDRGSLVATRGASAAAEPELEAATGLGDAGESLDPTAKEAYRRRVEELREELEEAESFNDPERAARAREEMDFIAAELSSAVGLGGRDRKAASASERARVNVTRAIKSCVKRIAEHDADLGSRLDATVKTGTFCSYQPGADLELALGEGPPAAEAAAVEPAPAGPAPDIHVPARPAALLIGRKRELDQLERALEEACGGRGSLQLIGGEPGVGKTHLADALSGRARDRGAVALWGHCWEGGGAPAFWPWVEVIRSYVRDHDASEILERIGPAAGYVAQLVPELAEETGPEPAAPAVESEQARFALFDSVSSFLRYASRRMPLVVLLDDLHAADEPSLLLLDFLSHQLPSTNALVVGTYRRGEGRPATVELLGHLAAHGQLLPLAGLGQEEVGSFIEQKSGAAASPEVVDALHGATEGNPFFMEEIMRLLGAQGLLEQPGALAAEHLPVPEGVRETIRGRLEPLPDEAIRVLQLAAVLGKQFTLPALEHASEELSRERLLELLDEPEARGIVSQVPGVLGHYRFVHALVREVLYDGLSASARLELHRRAAKGLERLYSADPEPHLAELAHHFLKAAAAGQVEKAVDYAARAGHRAMSLLAFEDAVLHYEHALLALELTGAADQAVRCELLLVLGEALSRMGEPAKAKETFRSAGDLARRLGVRDAEARAALGFAGRHWTVGAADDATVRMLERGLAALGEEDSLLRAELLGRLATELYYSPVRERSAPLSQHAVEIARRVGDEGALARVLDARLAAVWGPENLDERLALATEVIELADRAGDAETALRGRAFRVTCLLERGDISSADLEIDTASRLAAELRQPRFIWHTTVLRALRSTMSGRLEDAERLAAEAFEAGRRADEGAALQLYLVQIAEIRHAQGRVAELEAPIKRFTEQLTGMPVWRCTLAVLYAELGDEAKARRELETAGAGDWRDVPPDSSWLPAMARAAEACAALRDAGRAARVYELLVPYRDRIVIVGRVANNSYGPATRHLGLLCTTMSRWEEAESHFRHALELSARTGQRLRTVQIQLDYARMLVARSQGEDRRRANELLDETLAAAEELGMAGPAEKARSARVASAP